jgi:hypothetical protein
VLRTVKVLQGVLKAKVWDSVRKYENVW